MSVPATVLERDLRQLINQPEDRFLEFKSYTPDMATTSQILSAFANTAGGTLIVGVKERGEVVGADIPKLLRVVERARQMLRPPQEIRLDTPTIDGKQIGVVQIGRSAQAPVFADAGVYVREGEATRPMAAADLTLRLRQAPEPLDLGEIAEAIASQTAMIESLREHLRAESGWMSKLKEHVISGLIGAAIGALVTKLFGG